MDKPIPEAVGALADELMEASEYEDDLSVRSAYADAAGRVRTLANALAAAQQQGQAFMGMQVVEVPSMEPSDIALVQPMQQGGGEVCRHEWITTGGGNGGPRRSLRCSKCHAHRDHIAPPSAPVGVDVIELGRLLVREREAVGGVFTPDWHLFREALAQQPAAVDEAEPLPEFLERVAQEVVERDTLAGTFAPGIAQALRGRASILRRALAAQRQEPTT